MASEGPRPTMKEGLSAAAASVGAPPYCIETRRSLLHGFMKPPHYCRAGSDEEDVEIRRSPPTVGVAMRRLQTPWHGGVLGKPALGFVVSVVVQQGLYHIVKRWRAQGGVM